jgi:hypothetical protein
MPLAPCNRINLHRNAGTKSRRRRSCCVPHFKIEIVNEEFVAADEFECESQLSAREQAVASAFDIAIEQVKAASSSSAPSSPSAKATRS